MFCIFGKFSLVGLGVSREKRWTVVDLSDLSRKGSTTQMNSPKDFYRYLNLGGIVPSIPYTSFFRS